MDGADKLHSSCNVRLCMLRATQVSVRLGGCATRRCGCDLLISDASGVSVTTAFSHGLSSLTSIGQESSDSDQDLIGDASIRQV